MSEDLTRFDLKILGQMQKDCSLSTGEIAERVGLSQSPCWRRLQRLKDEGFIKRQVAVLDRAKVGTSLCIFAYLKMNRLSEQERAEFLRTIEITPEIVECYTVFGDMDIFLKVIAQSMEWYQAFVFNTIFSLPGVVDINSTITCVDVKSTTEIPLPGL